MVGFGRQQNSGTRERLRRRVVTIPGVLLGFVLFVILALPALLIGGLARYCAADENGRQ